MDNPLSFSLGITQLDAIVEDIPLGFVLATFDEQDPDWAENRSKHRNDPVTMKKLWDKTASKSKKSTSKASKKKVNDFGQPRLSKGIEYRIDKVPPHPLHMHSYKNIQPTTEEVNRLNFSFSKDFETCDPTTYASTSDSRKLKRTADELQLHVGTIAEEFGDFITIPPRKILIKAGFASPVSPGQPLKKRKIIMFDETHKDTTDKGEIGVSEIQLHHHGEIGVFPQSHQHNFVPSSSTQPEGTSKSTLDSDEIKNYINKCDVNVTTKEDVNEVNLKNQESTDVIDVQDEVSGTITDSIQAAVDIILFGLPTPSTTKSLNVGASNKMTKRHWDLLDSQIPPDFPDAQVQQLQASKAKAPAKRETKKSRFLRSPYISKYGSGSKDAVAFDKEEKLKKETDNHYQVNASRLGYRQLDFVVAHPQSKNWFYLMSERKTCWNNEYLDVIFYYLRKKSKIQLGDNYRYMMAIFFSKTYVEKTHTRYYPAKPAVELSMQQDYVESIVVAKNEDAIANIIHKFCMPVGLPWYMVDEIYISINCDKEFYWVLAVIVLKERLVRMYDSLSSKRKKEPPIEILKLAVMLPTYLSDNGFYDKTQRTD
ncbi:hypothetical protein T459_22866 [Capsicum annuum]|uniref:Ubiquitin-like protease family profile domain-containing protein n=1 Tax=Capsicum annuum TaxID=4072 RepID=A0A2G2YR34_CAPAN|nr:hypothetical protein T459_22866 [Capsicum annuum]